MSALPAHPNNAKNICPALIKDSDRKTIHRSIIINMVKKRYKTIYILFLKFSGLNIYFSQTINKKYDIPQNRNVKSAPCHREVASHTENRLKMCRTTLQAYPPLTEYRDSL